MATTIEAAPPAAAQPTNAEKISKLPWGLFAAGTNTIFAQFTIMGSVFILFLNSLGLSKTSIGLLLSFFPFFGLTALFTGATPAGWRDEIYYRYYHDPGHHQTAAHYGIRTNTHKLIYYWKQDQWELFDLTRDPDEMRKLEQDLITKIALPA